jgi:hypothetical protein
MSSSPAPQPAAPEHEFSPDDERVFVGLARDARFVGRAGLALGVLLGLAGGVGLVRPTALLSPRASLFASLVGVATGLAAAWAGRHLLAASRDLDAVALTRDRDVTHLMRAMRSLRGAFVAFAAALAVDVVAAAFTALALWPQRSHAP